VRFGRRELVLGSVGAPLGEEPRPIEADELLLDHPTHHVRRILLVDPVACAPLEAVTVQECQEELERLFVPVVGRGRHQQEVAAVAADDLAQAVALGALDFARLVGGAHPVRLVDDDQVPLVGGEDALLQVLVPAELVHPRDQAMVVLERVRRPGRRDHVAREEVELEPELLGELVLPLLGQAARRDDQAALQVAPDEHLLDQESRHDRLAGPGVVRQQEAHGESGEHRLVDRADLVRQRLDGRGADRDVGVEEPGEAEAVGFGGEAEPVAATVEGPGAGSLGDGQRGLTVAEQDTVAQGAVGAAEDDSERVRPVPVHMDDRDGHSWHDTVDRAAGLDVFELHWGKSPASTSTGCSHMARIIAALDEL